MIDVGMLRYIYVWMGTYTCFIYFTIILSAVSK